jgi:hypothetical protein
MEEKERQKAAEKKKAQSKARKQRVKEKKAEERQKEEEKLRKEKEENKNKWFQNLSDREKVIITFNIFIEYTHAQAFKTSRRRWSCGVFTADYFL